MLLALFEILVYAIINKLNSAMEHSWHWHLIVYKFKMQLLVGFYFIKTSLPKNPLHSLGDRP